MIAIIFNNLGLNNPGVLEEKLGVIENPQVRMGKINYYTMQVFGGIFFACTNSFMGNLFNTLLVFQEERPVFLREQSNKMYGVTPYFICKVLVDTPVLFMGPMLTSILVYFSMGLETSASQFFSFYLSLSFLANSAASLGYLLSSLFEDEAKA